MGDSDPEKNLRAVIRANAALPASNAREVNSTINVSAVRTLNLIIQVTAAAAGNIVSIVPEGIFQAHGGTLLWVPLGVTDGTLTTNDLATLASGESYTRYNFASQDWQPLDIRTKATDNNNDVVIFSVPLNVSAYQQLRCAVSQVDGGTAPSLALWGAGAS